MSSPVESWNEGKAPKMDRDDFTHYSIPPTEDGFHVAIYIAILADENGVIWARDMVDGHESQKYDTVMIPFDRQIVQAQSAVYEVMRMVEDAL